MAINLDPSSTIVFNIKLWPQWGLLMKIWYLTPKGKKNENCFVKREHFVRHIFERLTFLIFWVTFMGLILHLFRAVSISLDYPTISNKSGVYITIHWEISYCWKNTYLSCIWGSSIFFNALMFLLRSSYLLVNLF